MLPGRSKSLFDELLFSVGVGAFQVCLYISLLCAFLGEAAYFLR